MALKLITIVLLLLVASISTHGGKVFVGDPIGLSKLPVPNLLASYDYIVVGSGSSGAVIAARLTENPAITVLLLEAGGAGSIITEIPGMVGITLNSNLDWQYK